MFQKNFKKNDAHMSADKDDETLDREEWNPTPDQMADYLYHEMEMAKSNLLLVLKNSGYPVLFKEIKECMLHSPDTIDRVLSHHLKAGNVKEVQGKFVLAV